MCGPSGPGAADQAGWNSICTEEEKGSVFEELDEERSRSLTSLVGTP